MGLERAMTGAGGDPNPFIDLKGHLAHIDMQERPFLEMPAGQEAGPLTPGPRAAGARAPRRGQSAGGAATPTPYW